jgi:(S)-2-hydroxyglutarate dehydrogenase
VKKSCDVLIVGAGIVGLTVAWELINRDPSLKIIILEKESSIGQHASGRNSGVLHSGIFYADDSLKAKLCASGSRQMQEFSNEHKIACNKSGKVIVATSESDLEIIDKLMKNAQANGVIAKKLNEKEVKDIEPYANVFQSGIYTPETAVIDSKAVLEKLRYLLKDNNVIFKLSSPLVSQVEENNTVTTSKDTFSYGYLYNCAGANADRIAKMFGKANNYTLIPFKGIYYKLNQEKDYLVNSNIYPTPDVKLPFLGVHITRVIDGNVYIGPTAIPAFGRENYGILKGMNFQEVFEIGSELIKMYKANRGNFRLLAHNETKKYYKPWFLESAKKLIPSLDSNDLISTNKVGIRPQLVNIKTKKIEMDYVLEQTKNSTHVLNSISPAFSCAFSFAKYIINYSGK